MENGGDPDSSNIRAYGEARSGYYARIEGEAAARSGSGAAAERCTKPRAKHDDCRRVCSRLRIASSESPSMEGYFQVQRAENSMAAIAICAVLHIPYTLVWRSTWPPWDRRLLNNSLAALS